MTKLLGGLTICGLIYGANAVASQPFVYYPPIQPNIQFSMPGLSVVIPGQPQYQPYYQPQYQPQYQPYYREWGRDHHEGHRWHNHHRWDDD